MTDLTRDLREAARRLARTPMFTVATWLTLALGIGANTAIFSIVNSALLKPLPFPEPDRLDLARHPNRHLAFGVGIHACAGMWLARMEGQVAIGRLVRRFGTIEPDGPPTRGGRARFRGFLRYPVRVRP